MSRKGSSILQDNISWPDPFQTLYLFDEVPLEPKSPLILKVFHRSSRLVSPFLTSQHSSVLEQSFLSDNRYLYRLHKKVLAYGL